MPKIIVAHIPPTINSLNPAAALNAVKGSVIAAADADYVIGLWPDGTAKPLKDRHGDLELTVTWKARG